MLTTEIYLQPAFYNPVCDAYISGAWIAVCDDGEVPICRDYEAKDKDDAEAQWLGRFQ